MTSKTISQAFIIGNGTSREQINLSGLKEHGKIYGCNALYRTFSDYDVLVAIDDGMIKELIERNVPRVVIPPENERWEDARYSPSRRRSNAGMNAMSEAIKHGSSKIFCLGFDFILTGDQSVSNLFDGTDNYGPETRARREDNYYRLKYLEWFMNDNKNVDFVFVLPKDQEFATMNADNVNGIYVDDFKSKFIC